MIVDDAIGELLQKCFQSMPDWMDCILLDASPLAVPHSVVLIELQVVGLLETRTHSQIQPFQQH
jgi:hypothetical protein